MTAVLRAISPVDGRVYVERPLAGESQIAAALAAARNAQRDWKRVPVAERADACAHMVDAFVACREEIAEEIGLEALTRPKSFHLRTGD